MDQPPDAPATIDDGSRVSLVELVDRVLNKGAVIVGNVTISVTDIDLVKLGLQIVLGGADSFLVTDVPSALKDRSR